MSISYDDLLSKAISMHERGDRLRSIVAYLDEHASEEEVRTILREVKMREANGELHLQKEKPSVNYTNFIFGGILFGLGAFLANYLWNTGWISTLPFIIMGIGILAALKGQTFT